MFFCKKVNVINKEMKITKSLTLNFNDNYIIPILLKFLLLCKRCRSHSLIFKKRLQMSLDKLMLFSYWCLIRNNILYFSESSSSLETLKVETAQNNSVHKNDWKHQHQVR